MKDGTLHECEFAFMQIVWENEPLSSRMLADKAEAVLGWKRTTSYTVLKKLCDGGYLENNDTVVTARIKKEDALRLDYERRVSPMYNGDFPLLFDIALTGVSLSDKDARALKRVIDKHRAK